MKAKMCVSSRAKVEILLQIWGLDIKIHSRRMTSVDLIQSDTTVWVTRFYIAWRKASVALCACLLIHQLYIYIFFKGKKKLHTIHLLVAFFLWDLFCQLPGVTALEHTDCNPMWCFSILRSTHRITLFQEKTENQ